MRVLINGEADRATGTCGPGTRATGDYRISDVTIEARRSPRPRRGARPRNGRASTDRSSGVVPRSRRCHGGSIVARVLPVAPFVALTVWPRRAEVRNMYPFNAVRTDSLCEQVADGAYTAASRSARNAEPRWRGIATLGTSCGERASWEGTPEV